MTAFNAAEWLATHKSILWAMYLQVYHWDYDNKKVFMKDIATGPLLLLMVEKCFCMDLFNLEEIRASFSKHNWKVVP